MRLLALVALVALAACSSDPPPAAPDASGADADAGVDAAPETAVDAPSVAPDAADVPSPPPDAPAPAEAAVDVAPEASGPCVDRDGDGYGAGCAAGPDCDDGDPTTYPGAPERCDGRDNNCDTVPDDRTEAAARWCAEMFPAEFPTRAPTLPRCEAPRRSLNCPEVEQWACVGCCHAPAPTCPTSTQGCWSVTFAGGGPEASRCGM